MDFFTILAVPIGAVITGFASYYVTKNSDYTKYKFENAEKAKTNILDMIQNFLELSEITETHPKEVISEIRQINDRIGPKSENYFLAPPRIIEASHRLARRVTGLQAQKSDSDNWDKNTKQEIVNQYKELRRMLYRFEQTVRKNLGCPSDTTYEDFRYHFGSPALVILSLMAFAVYWFLGMVASDALFKDFGFFIYVVSSMVIAFVMIFVKIHLDKRKEDKYFLPVENSQNEDTNTDN